MQSTATVKLNLETTDFATKANDASTGLLGIQLAAGGASLAFKGLGGAARSSLSELALGAVAIDKLSVSLGKAAVNSGKLSAIAGSLSSFAYNTALVTTAVGGLVDAADAFNRIPQTLGAISASGVNTQTILEFQEMRTALMGNKEAVEGFVNTAISRLGQFEQAAARSATILKSNTRFDEGGNALRVNAKESLDNALSIQKLVGSKLDNAVTSSDALLAQYEVLSAGFAKQSDSEQVLETALKLTQISKAGGVNANTAENTKLLAKTLQAYGLGAGDAAKTGAILNGVVENGITTIQELSNGFGAAGSSASKAGISMSALGAGVATLTSLGQDTSEAFTGLKGLSDAIVNKTPEANAELAKLSLNGQRIRFDIAEVQAKGLVQALLDVNKAAGNSPQILAKIFPDAVTSRAVTGLLSQDGAGFKSRFESINSATGSGLDEVAKLASDTRVVNMQKLANKFGEIVITIAQNVAPVVEPGLNALKAIADGFNAIPEPVKQALGAWIAAQLTIQSSTVAIGILVKTLGDLAGIYAFGRVAGLLFSGQLGAELTIIKELIVQRKGLGSVILQTIGINQRHRLSVDAASAALVNQGVVAKGVYAAQAKGAEVVAAAGNKARDIFARNVAGARAVAAELGSSPTAGRAVNAGMNAIDRARNVARAVADSQTGKNVSGAVGGLLDRNPAIGTAAEELKGVARSAIDRVKAEAAKFTQSDTYKNIVGAATGATKTVQATVERVGVTATAKLVPTAAEVNKARLDQITNAQLQLNSPELVANAAKINAGFQATQTELAALEKTYADRVKELARKQKNFVDRAGRLEEIKDRISPESYQKSVNKLNKDATRLTDLGGVVDRTKRELYPARSRAIQQEQDASFINASLNSRVNRANAKFAPLVAIETKLQNINEAAQAAATKASSFKSYAANLNNALPGSEEANAASIRAQKEAARSARIQDRATALGSQYQELLDSTGARTALLSERGLAQVKYGGGTATYSTNSKLESALYADVGKAATKAFEWTKGIGLTTVGTAFTFLTTNATRAALALGNMAKAAVLQPLATTSVKIEEYVKGLFGRGVGGLKSIYQEGGIGGLARAGAGLPGKGFNAFISGSSQLGKTFLPFLPEAIAGAVAAPAAVAALGAVVLRDDYARGKLAGEFRDSVDATLKKYKELKAKYEDRQQPIAELRSAVAQIKEGNTFAFTQKPNAQTASARTTGAIDGILSAPGRLAGGIGSGAGSIGGAINSTAADKFTLEGVSALKTLDPVRDQLKLLAQAGQLTGDQFKDLDSTLAKMGKSGKISAEELAKFTAKLEAIKGQEKPKARGVLDSVGNALYNAPGALLNWGLDRVDGAANEFGSIFSGSIAKSAANREADALISYLGDGRDEGSLSSLINTIGDANVETRQDLATYRKGGALDALNVQKLQAGKGLESADLDRERLLTTNRIDRNNLLVANYDADTKNLNEQLAKQKDPENKTLLENSIKALTAQKEAVQKNTEGLKASQEAFTKYHAETLPGLVRALKESTDPTKAIALAQEDFGNIYQKDSTGQTTTYFKNIAELRQDSAKYVESLLTKYSIDNSDSAESTTIEGLKTARDNQITLSNGESGSRETIAQRLGLTDQIVKIQAAGTQKLIAGKTLETDRLKVLTSSGAIAEREAQIQTNAIAVDVTRARLAAKEREIQEYAAFPRKVVELEQEAATLRIQVEQQVADTQRAIRERNFALTQARFELQGEYLKSAQAELRIGATDAIVRSGEIEINKAKAALQKLYQDRSRLTTASPELDNQIGKAEQQVAQTIAQNTTQVFEAQLAVKKQIVALDASVAILPLNVANKQLEITQKIGNFQSDILNANKEALTSSIDNQTAQLDNESKLANTSVGRAKIELDQSNLKLDNIAAVQGFERQSLIIQQELVALGLQQQQNQLKISQIESQRGIKELELQRLKLDRDKSNSPEIIAQRKELELQLTTARLQEQSLGNQGELLSKQGEVNRQVTESKLKQNIANQAITTETAKIDTLLKSINVKTAQIGETTERQNLAFTAQTQKLTARSNALELQTKQIENQTKLITTQKGLIVATADARVGELGIMNNLTTIESVKLNIAQQTATLKLASLTTQLQYEKDILELNLQQQQSSYKQDQLKQQISEKSAERDIINSRASYEKLLAKGKLADPNELKAAELDLSSKFDAAALVRSNRDILAQQGQILDYSGKAQRYQLELTQKGQLQGALAEAGSALPDSQKAYFENRLFNAVGRQEDGKYYKAWADDFVKEAKQNPIVLPQFDSPYDPRSNYNNPAVADPTKVKPLGSVLYRSDAGSLDLNPRVDAPTFNPINYDNYQRDAQARYQEFVRTPVKIEISSQAQLQSQQEAVRRTDSSSPPTTAISVNLQMTNDIKVSVADAAATKEPIVTSTLQGLEDVIRLVKEKYS